MVLASENIFKSRRYLLHLQVFIKERLGKREDMAFLHTSFSGDYSNNSGTLLLYHKNIIS